MDDLDAPIVDESTFLDLEVDGRLPPSLDGSFLQIGRNPIGDRRRDDGMVHQVVLRGGRAVSYRNRWVVTDPTAAALGVEPVPGPPPGPVDRATDRLLPLGPARVLAWSDGSLPYELDLDRLDTLRRLTRREATTDPGPCPPSTARAGGWIVAFVQDRVVGRTALVVRDAAEPTIVVASVWMPRRVPSGRQAIWIPSGRPAI